MKKNKVLIIAAHPDDELLGVAGILLNHIKAGDKVHILLLSDGETSRDKHNVGRRRKQAKKVALKLGAKSLHFEDFPDNSFDSLPLLSIIKILENYIFSIKPNIVYTHHLHDLNVDHRLTAQATLTACRPQPSFFVKKIYTFETSSSTEYQAKMSNYLFLPTFYCDITPVIKEKLKLLKIYKNEIQKAPHSRSFRGIIALAAYVDLKLAKILRSISTYKGN